MLRDLVDGSEFYNGGAMDLITYEDNMSAFNRYRIRPRVLADVSNVDMSAEIYGQKVRPSLLSWSCDLGADRRLLPFLRSRSRSASLRARSSSSRTRSVSWARRARPPRPTSR